jgi:murein DD-endopeptidase MepM/ murein hydrolase activator NlpD
MRTAAIERRGGEPEGAGRGIVLFWSTILLFVAGLVWWVPRHRLRPAPARPAAVPARAAPAPAVRSPASVRREPTPIPMRAAALSMPIAGLSPSDLRDSFDEIHSGHRHEAIDILEPRGTPVLAVDGGRIVKLFHSIPGGITIYQFDPTGTLCYYYAHLDRYARGLAEGQRVAAGQTIGYVGTTGNAPPQTPHLHFAIYRLGPEKHWWQGAAIDPYPVLLKARPAP